MDRESLNSELLGASLVEYAVLLLFVSVFCYAAVLYLGEAVSKNFSSTASQL